MDKIPLLVETLPYIRKFRGKTFVLKLGGSSLKDPETLAGIATDCSVLHGLGMRIVIVHGGGPQADELLQRLGHPVRKVSGRRVTDRQTLEVAKMIYSGKINIEIVAALQRGGLHSVGISGVDANTVLAEKRKTQKIKNPKTGKMEEVDFGHVGDISCVDASLIRFLLDKDYVPVIASLGADRAGRILNINADTVAAEISVELGAEKLINVSNVPGILEDPADRSSTISYLNIEKAKKLEKTGTVSGGMVPKLATCIAAVEGGVRRAHIIDGTAPRSILIEIFTNQGCGTMIVSKQEERKYLHKNGMKTETAGTGTDTGAAHSVPD